MAVNIHGKSYVTVAERISAAGDELIGVDTQVLYTEPVVIKATIITKKGTFTGISAANPNKQLEAESPWEVAETSAVGRALAFAGYETTNGIASAEEMRKISSPTPTTSPKPAQPTTSSSTISPKQADYLYKLMKKTGRDSKGMIFEFGAAVEDMTAQQASKAIEKLMKEAGYATN